MGRGGEWGHLSAIVVGVRGNSSDMSRAVPLSFNCFLLGLTCCSFATLVVLGSQKTEHEFPDVANLPLQKGLPDPFLMPNGKRVSTPRDWQRQREYLKAMLANYMYGRVPARPKEIEIKRVGTRRISGDQGVEERYTLTIRRNGKSVTCDFLFTRPILKKRYPTVIKNDRVSFDNSSDSGPSPDTFDPGTEAIKRGYLLCRFSRTDLATDTRGAGRKAGVYPLYPEYDWAALAVWGWGHGVILDALNQLEVADMSKVVATGHSRGGKAALCAGIYDERIAITAPNSSGTGGTGSLRYFEDGQRPQTIGHHIGRNERWFHPGISSLRITKTGYRSMPISQRL